MVDSNTNSRFTQSALALLMPRVCANYSYNTVATNNFTITADFLDRCLNSHGLSFTIKVKSQPIRLRYKTVLFCQIISIATHTQEGTNIKSFIKIRKAKQAPHVRIKNRFYRSTNPQKLFSTFYNIVQQTYPEQYLPLKVRFLKKPLVLMRKHIRLHLSHEIHSYHN